MLKKNLGIAEGQEPKYDLQLFAEEENAETETVDTPENTTEDTTEELNTDDSTEETTEDIAKKLEYTPEELEKELQRRSDKIVTKALKTQREKIYKDFQKKQEEEKLKAEKKYKELYERQQNEIEAERKELALERKRNEAQKILNSKGLDPELINFLNIKEDTDIYEVVDDFSKSLEGLINNKVEQISKKSQQSVGRTVSKTSKPIDKDKEIENKVKSITGAKYKQQKNPYFKN